jgi:uncharacterized delta-60 repeat protein
MGFPGGSRSPKGRRLGWAAIIVSIPFLILVVQAWASNQTGELDPSFGNRGRAVAALPREGASIRVVMGQDRFGRAYLANSTSVLAFDADGRLDRRFAQDGRLSLSRPAVSPFRLADIAVDHDGRLLVAGIGGDSNRAVVYRFNPGGQLDRSFGQQGVVVTELGLPPPIVQGAAPLNQAQLVSLNGLIVDHSDRPVLTGSFVASIGACRDLPSASVPAAYFARLEVSGALDPSFGDAGHRIDPQLSTVHDPVVTPDDGISYIGSGPAGCGSPHYFGLGRLRANGSPDHRFGQAGWKALSSQLPLREALDPNGRLLVLMPSHASGTSGAAAPARHRNESIGAVLRLARDGSLDRRFGRSGSSILRLPARQSRLAAMIADPRGRVLLAGTRAPGVNAAGAYSWFLLLRLTADGRPDNSLGHRGRVVTRFGAEGMADGLDIGFSNGRVLLGGFLRSPAFSTDRAIALARYKAGP